MRNYLRESAAAGSSSTSKSSVIKNFCMFDSRNPDVLFLCKKQTDLGRMTEASWRDLETGG